MQFVGFKKSLDLSGHDPKGAKSLEVRAAFLALDADRADAYVAARSTVSPFFKDNEEQKFVTTPIAGTEERYAFAISPKSPELLPLINKVIETIKQDGTLQKLKSKWGIA